MAIAFVQEWTTDNATPGSAVAPSGPSTTAGSLLVVRCSLRSAVALANVSVSDSAGNVWNTITFTPGDVGFQVFMFYALVTDPVTSVSVTSDQSGNLRAILSEYSGVAGFASSDTSSTPNQDTPWPATELTINPGELFVGMNVVWVTNRTIALVSSVPPWAELSLSSGGQTQVRGAYMVHSGSTTVTGPQWDVTAGSGTSAAQISAVFTEDTSATDVVINDKPTGVRAYAPRIAAVESGTVTVNDLLVGALRATGPGPVHVLVNQSLFDFPSAVRAGGPVEGSSGGTLTVSFPPLEVEFEGNVPSVAGSLATVMPLLEVALTGGTPDTIGAEMTVDFPLLEVDIQAQGPNSGDLEVMFPALEVEFSSTSEAPPIQDTDLRVRISIVDMVFPVRWPGWQWSRRRVR